MIARVAVINMQMTCLELKTKEALEGFLSLFLRFFIVSRTHYKSNELVSNELLELNLTDFIKASTYLQLWRRRLTWSAPRKRSVHFHAVRAVLGQCVMNISQATEDMIKLQRQVPIPRILKLHYMLFLTLYITQFIQLCLFQLKEKTMLLENRVPVHPHLHQTAARLLTRCRCRMQSSGT